MHRNITAGSVPWLGGIGLGLIFLAWGTWQVVTARATEDLLNASSAESQAEQPSQAQSADGRELFHRGWLPKDPRSPEGDGLGPMFNESSCVGCHNQGGPGGAGPASKNVDLLTAFIHQPVLNRANISGIVPRGNGPSGLMRHRKNLSKQLGKIHPGFTTGSSVVVHRFGTSSQHSKWRENLLTSQPQQFAQPVSVSFAPQVVPGTPVEVNASTEADPVADTPATFVSDPPPSEPPARNPETFPEPATGTPIGLPSPPQFGNTALPGFVQQPQQITATATGIPLVDEALSEMRRLQQQTRKDVTGTLQRGQVVMLRSQRNTTALFGAGVIDAIPDSALIELASKKYEDFPRVNGRVHRLPNGKIGKFGWKAQKPSLRDFTLAACANELGLDVPGHRQPAVPYEKGTKTKGHDMTNNQADALVAYVRSLPAPIQETPKDREAANIIEDGEKLFESVGCAVCHTPNVGEAKGVYSDLLLHDLGDKLQASGSYGTALVPHQVESSNESQSPGTDEGSSDGQAAPGSEGSGQQVSNPSSGSSKQVKSTGPTSAEWRTPPLWGLRDSAPYLHDGRAATVEQAIALHGGEGSDSAIRYFLLLPKKRQKLVAFLKTLRAPDQRAAR